MVLQLSALNPVGCLGIEVGDKQEAEATHAPFMPSREIFRVRRGAASCLGPQQALI